MMIDEKIDSLKDLSGNPLRIVKPETELDRKVYRAATRLATEKEGLTKPEEFTVLLALNKDNYIDYIFLHTSPSKETLEKINAPTELIEELHPNDKTQEKN